MITKQRDLAQSRVEDLLQMLEDERDKKHLVSTSRENAIVFTIQSYLCLNLLAIFESFR